MKKTTTRLLITFVLILVLASLLAVAAFAATPGSGYCVNTENKQTNIKWTMEEDGTLTFEIDAAATDKVKTTVLYGIDPVTGAKNSWAKSLPTFGDAVKIVIGDGITEINGFSAMEKLNQVEIPTSLVKLGYGAFQCSRVIKSIYIRGTEPVDGLYDLSNITSFGQYAFDSAHVLTKVKLNPNYVGVLEFELFKNTALTEVEIPAGVTVIKNNSFMNSTKLTVMTILGMGTTFESNDVFKSNKTFPIIKAKEGSKAAEFAKANGYTFIDLDTGKETKGTKSTTGKETKPTTGEETKPTTGSSDSPITVEGSKTIGYCVNNNNQQTNIKWTMEENGVLTFEIDATATDKVQTTELYGKDPVTGTTNSWKNNLPTFANAVKIVIGDGITAIAGFSAMEKLQQVEIPKSLVKVKDAAFECSRILQSVYVRGTSPSPGTFDFTYVTSFGTYCCDSAEKLTKIILNPSLAGVLPMEFVKNTKITELEIPAGVTKITDGVLMNTKSLKVLTILGMETTLQSDNVFKGNTTYPAIKAKAGSKAEEFAKANGYTFIDLDTGKKTKGTKATTGEASSGGTSTPSAALPEFDPEGATVWGHSSGKYNGSDIINTYWAYYQDTKTLEFVSATTNYNETGTISHVDKNGKTWENYKDEIEHIIIGDYIVKISGSAFKNYPALIDVQIGKNVSQIDAYAFANCANLTTIWRNTQERVDGTVDLRGLQKINDIISGTNVKGVILPNNTKSLSIDLPPSIKTIWVNEITDSLIEYAKTNLFNLQNINDPEDFYEFWVYYDYTLPACGGRSVFGFDEATGTLTIYGAGAIDDIVNYYGGGSKKQPWFSIRQNVKHIVISDNITKIGRYAFCEFSNLETVQIPDTEDFDILNGAFEKCYNLKSVYRAGTEPIEGTIDIRNIHILNSWTFAYDYLIANIIISPEVTKIGTSVFEENITINLANVYGTPGSYAEQYAAENGLAFYDISVSTPVAITCIPPETTAVETETEAPKTTSAPETEISTESGSDTNADPENTPLFIDEADVSGSSANPLPIIIAVIAVVVIAAAVVVLVVIFKKKKASQ